MKMEKKKVKRIVGFVNVYAPRKNNNLAQGSLHLEFHKSIAAARDSAYANEYFNHKGIAKVTLEFLTRK
jgi:hypothetical protein